MNQGHSLNFLLEHHKTTALPFTTIEPVILQINRLGSMHLPIWIKMQKGKRWGGWGGEGKGGVGLRKVWWGSMGWRGEGLWGWVVWGRAGQIRLKGTQLQI